FAIDRLSDEIRRYPTPIARCDEQLTALIEERSLLLSQLNSFPVKSEPCSPLALWVNDGGFNAA
ncbi:MAG TPA: hypothetical protein VMU46_17710, partial [Burkholderiales bacterium]|nr:hypothetical protein [Burkholderiales bacterium]